MFKCTVAIDKLNILKKLYKREKISNELHDEVFQKVVGREFHWWYAAAGKDLVPRVVRSLEMSTFERTTRSQDKQRTVEFVRIYTASKVIDRTVNVMQNLTENQLKYFRSTTARALANFLEDLSSTENPRKRQGR